MQFLGPDPITTTSIILIRTERLLGALKKNGHLRPSVASVQYLVSKKG